MPAEGGTKRSGGARSGKSLGEYATRFTRDKIQSVAAQRVSTGFPALDRSLNGGLANGLYVLGAVPGLGKSTLALQISHHLSGQGIPVLYFALEMNWAWITAKSICRTDYILNRQEGLQAAALLDAGSAQNLSDEEWERVNRARELTEREGANLYIYEPGPDMTHIGHIQEKIRDFKALPANRERYGDKPLMVVIDYLQILAPKNGLLRVSDKQIVDENVRTLCKIRDQEKVIILLISALNRSSYDNPINLGSFKESGSIEYSADAILGMQYRGVGKDGFSAEKAREKTPRELELTLLKMRYGRDGVKIPLHFYSESSFFQQPDGGGEAADLRLQELREKFRDYPVQYHDGFHQKAHRPKG